MERLEQKIEKNADAIAALTLLIGNVQQRDEFRAEFMCAPHGVHLKNIEKQVKANENEIDIIHGALKNRWPTLLAAAVGGMMPVIGLVLAVWKTKVGTGG